MRVLLSQKVTGLNRRGEYVRKCVESGILAKSRLDRLQIAHDEHVETFRAIQDELSQAGIDFTRVGGGRYWPNSRDFDAVIAVGGDGTVLESSHHVDNSQTPLIGVRSSSDSLGYLCAYGGKHDLKKLLHDLKTNQLKSISVARIQAHVYRIDSQHEVSSSPTLNDFLFCNANPAATSRYNLTIGSSSEEHKSSGIWLAGPAGSTAAIHAAGGEPVELDSGIFQYRVRELIQSPSVPLSLDKGVFEPDALKIENHCSRAVLVPDGVMEPIKMSFGDRIRFCLADSLRIVVR